MDLGFFYFFKFFSLWEWGLIKWVIFLDLEFEDIRGFRVVGFCDLVVLVVFL